MRLPRVAVAAIAVFEIATAGCGGKPAPAQPAQRPKLSARDIYQASSPAIVEIDVVDPRGSRVGTGFIVDAKGLIATNLHVVGGSDKIKVKLNDGHEYDVREV